MPALVMGVLNVTPDSFSDGGRYFDHEAAVERGVEMVREGADVVDVGGESTRPGADPVPEDEELRRVVPVIEALAGQVRLSVDTCKPGVAEAAVRAGASLINDVSASLEEVAAHAGVGWVAMHMKGTPRTMQADPHYDDVVAEVASFLRERSERGERAGVGEIWIDPGIGFGKTAGHNLELLRHLDALIDLGGPVLVGSSRKSFLGSLGVREGLGTNPVEERLEASLASAVWAASRGASMVRVHDVAATVQALSVIEGEVPAPTGSERSP